jgi:hypothetical protein
MRKGLPPFRGALGRDRRVVGLASERPDVRWGDVPLEDRSDRGRSDAIPDDTLAPRGPPPVAHSDPDFWVQVGLYVGALTVVPLILKFIASSVETDVTRLRPCSGRHRVQGPGAADTARPALLRQRRHSM